MTIGADAFALLTYGLLGLLALLYAYLLHTTLKRDKEEKI